MRRLDDVWQQVFCPSIQKIDKIDAHIMIFHGTQDEVPVPHQTSAVFLLLCTINRLLSEKGQGFLVRN